MCHRWRYNQGVLPLFIHYIVRLTLAQQNSPALFYTLSATTEFIAALLFLVPGLVPTKQELEMQQSQAVETQRQYYAEAMPMNPVGPRYSSRV